MCGRFTLTAEVRHLEERFAFETSDMQYTPSYNIAPGQPVFAVVQHDTRRGDPYAGDWYPPGPKTRLWATV